MPTRHLRYAHTDPRRYTSRAGYLVSHLSPAAAWRPAVLTGGDVSLIAVSAVMQAWLRAWDYGTGMERGRASLRVVEAGAPLWLWTLVLTIGGLTLALGLAARRHLAVWLGHVILGTTYGALMVGLIVAALDEPWMDGIRGGTALLVLTVVHWILAIRTGPHPIDPDEGEATAEIIGSP